MSSLICGKSHFHPKAGEVEKKVQTDLSSTKKLRRASPQPYDHLVEGAGYSIATVEPYRPGAYAKQTPPLTIQCDRHPQALKADLTPFPTLMVQPAEVVTQVKKILRAK